jgi:hypothetical protein
MTINPVQKSLFTADTVFIRSVVKRNPLIERLDTRVNDLVLQIIGILALSIAVGGVIGLTITGGWTVTSIVVVVSLVVLGCMSLYLRSHFFRYHNPYVLRQYQEQAMHLSRKLRYLDDTDFLRARGDAEKNVIKRRLLRPLSMLVERHSSVATILRHSILPPEELQRAFNLETKYLELPEAFALYTQIRESAPTAPNYDISAFTSQATLQEWKEKLRQYLAKQVEIIQLSSATNCIDPLEELIQVVQKVELLMQRCFQYGILTEQQDVFQTLPPAFLRDQMNYQRFVAGQCPQIALARKLASLNLDYYQRHHVHERLLREQNSILEGIEDIQKEEEDRIKDVESQYDLTFLAIQSRKPNDDREKALDTEQRQFFTARMNKEKAAIVQESADRLDRYMERGVSGEIVGMLTTLDKHKSSLDQTYHRVFSTQLEPLIITFIRTYSASTIQEYRQRFVTHVRCLQNIANA